MRRRRRSGEVVRDGFGDLVAYVERVSGLPPEEVARFFATGMLMNVMASMDLYEQPEAWSERLLAGCKEGKLNRLFFSGGSK